MKCFREKFGTFPYSLILTITPTFGASFTRGVISWFRHLCFFFPFLVCEVISQKKEEDQYRMLLQAIAVARAGQFLMVDGALKTFFVVAIHLCKSDRGKICYHPYYTDRRSPRGLFMPLFRRCRF